MKSECADDSGMTSGEGSPQCYCYDGATYNPETQACECAENAYFALVDASCVNDCGANTTTSENRC